MLVYEAHYSHVLRLEASNPASVFSFNVVGHIKQKIRDVIQGIITMHPERWRLDLTEQHYAVVAWYSMRFYLYGR